jgi:ADP-ribosylation factor protein 1
MGFLFSKIVSSLFPIKDTRILLIGLDGAGKTTLLNRMKLNEYLDTVPTIGFNVEKVEYGNLKMTIWDVGGQGMIRKLWRHYYKGNDALIFIVDSIDEERIALAKEELHAACDDEELRDVTVLVFANKQDMATISPSELSSRLNLRGLRQEWYIQGCSAKSGDGVFDGFNWLSDTIQKKKRA